MPRTFEDSLASDCEDVFFNVNEFAKPVTITRGSDSTIDVAAIAAARSYESTNEYGISVSWQGVDFDVIATKYVIDSSVVEPKRGDKITDADGNVFEVVPPPNKHVYEPTGGDGKVFRVHTQRITIG